MRYRVTAEAANGGGAAVTAVCRLLPQETSPGAAFSRNLFRWLAAASEVNCWKWDIKKSFSFHKGGQTLAQKDRKVLGPPSLRCPKLDWTQP